MVILFLSTLIVIKKRKLYHKNKTPLHYAAEKNYKDIGEYLISKGVDINTKDIIFQIIKLLFFIKIIERK